MAQSRTVRRARPHQMSADPMAECAKTCHETLTYCLEQGGEHVESDHLKAMLDCADICTWTATLHQRQSPLAEAAMELCAQACKTCEESCGQFEGDETMQACAEACRTCYEHCAGK